MLCKATDPGPHEIETITAYTTVFAVAAIQGVDAHNISPGGVAATYLGPLRKEVALASGQV